MKQAITQPLLSFQEHFGCVCMRFNKITEEMLVVRFFEFNTPFSSKVFFLFFFFDHLAIELFSFSRFRLDETFWLLVLLVNAFDQNIIGLKQMPPLNLFELYLCFSMGDFFEIERLEIP